MQSKQIKTDGTLYAAGDSYTRRNHTADSADMPCVRVLRLVEARVQVNSFRSKQQKMLLVETVDPQQPDKVIPADNRLDASSPSRCGIDAHDHPDAMLVMPVDIYATWDDYQVERAASRVAAAERRNAVKETAATKLAPVERAVALVEAAGATVPTELDWAVRCLRKESETGIIQARGGYTHVISMAETIVAVHEHATRTVAQ